MRSRVVGYSSASEPVLKSRADLGFSASCEHETALVVLPVFDVASFSR